MNVWLTYLSGKQKQKNKKTKCDHESVFGFLMSFSVMIVYSVRFVRMIQIHQLEDPSIISIGNDNNWMGYTVSPKNLPHQVGIRTP